MKRMCVLRPVEKLKIKNSKVKKLNESAMMCFLPLEPKQTVIVTHALECTTTLLMRGAGSHNSSARVSQMCPSILYPLHACHSHGELGTSLQARRIQQSLHKFSSTVSHSSSSFGVRRVTSVEGSPTCWKLNRGGHKWRATCSTSLKV